MKVPTILRWVFGVSVAAFVLVGPIIYWRAAYNHSRRLREVTPGVLYRSGQLTAEGFEEAVQRYGIKTIVNLQNLFPDPELPASYFDSSTTSETELCNRLGVHYVFIAPDLVSRQQVGKERPQAIDQFLAVMDDPSKYPVLVHCKAGLHRTGIMAAVYRMEYEGWTCHAALREAIAHGFGRFKATSANDYITQYILSYSPGERRQYDARNPKN